MDFVETEGDTIDAAIESALKLLGVGRDKITVDIISEGRKGILGFGAQKARVRAELRKSPLEHKITAEPPPGSGEPAAAPIDNSAVIRKGSSRFTGHLKSHGGESDGDAERFGQRRRNHSRDPRR